MMMIAREMLMVLLFVACSTAWAEPLFAHVPPDQLRHPRLGPQPGSGPLVGGDIKACWSPWIQAKWCTNEFSHAMMDGGGMGPDCCNILKSVFECFPDHGKVKYATQFLNKYCGSGEGPAPASFIEEI